MKQIKNLSKMLKVTINDIAMCATSKAVKKYFEIYGNDQEVSI